MLNKVLLALLFGAAGAAAATEPLHDRIWYQSRAGIVYQSGKGAIDLPPSERLRAVARAQTCSAVGGPRGVYKYMSGKIWLVGLHRCGNGMGLSEVYPEMLTPPVAYWVDGVLIAKLGNILCRSPEGGAVFESEVRLTVESGNVVSLVEKGGGAHECPRKPAR